jgi:hypothetical protein
MCYSFVSDQWFQFVDKGMFWEIRSVKLSGIIPKMSEIDIYFRASIKLLLLLLLLLVVVVVVVLL